MLVSKSCRMADILLSHYSHSPAFGGLQSSRLWSHSPAFGGLQSSRLWSHSPAFGGLQSSHLWSHSPAFGGLQSSRLWSHSPAFGGLQSSRLSSSWTGIKRRSYWKYLKRSVLGASSPPYKRVTQTGDPVLRVQAQPVPPENISHPDTQAVLKSMVQLLKSCGCVGISAPQLGVPLRIMALELSEMMCQEVTPEVRTLREMDPFPLRIFINPTMRILDSRKLSFPEGCSSVEGFSAVVPRFYSVEISGVNEKGEHTSWTARGWAARIIQHEMDHLDGVLYFDKMDSRTFVNVNWMEVND